MLVNFFQRLAAGLYKRMIKIFYSMKATRKSSFLPNRFIINISIIKQISIVFVILSLTFKSLSYYYVKFI